MKLIWFQSMSSTELAESFNGPRSGLIDIDRSLFDPGRGQRPALADA